MVLWFSEQTGDVQASDSAEDTPLFLPHQMLAKFVPEKAAGLLLLPNCNQDKDEADTEQYRFYISMLVMILKLRLLAFTDA